MLIDKFILKIITAYNAFFRNLIDILKIVRDADFKQSKMLLIQRSDYMFDGSITKGDYKLRQVIKSNNINIKKIFLCI